MTFHLQQEVKYKVKQGIMNYLRWIRKVYPELKDTSDQIINSYIEEAKTSTEFFRTFIYVLGILFFVIPFNLYLYISDIHSFDRVLYWLLVIASFGVGGFVELYCEQKIIKRRIKKIVINRTKELE
ncbi:hypothetical protein Q4506_14220 [Colwellia sp. 4_MG-2023]|uniref:hypothetical protein n=1 Tax=unclassified Colwellia TaxID=196834 RepID=UPI002090A9F6|nr:MULTISPECIES: hypothetical protein [unclassified Colwellia]MDO6508136.1 hypothetical protein [Colwellia sp. 5_MG-2023]MDO6556840.1 hypothetical protein [Colwellia sp. 4_MG-2023]MDO6653816.1 hypothetical protein [Colwellia sp. 3_MG-2023]MDO6666672.1 hypothetical protein [Colwellia sp. 2_MG-2023]MDO6691113.1 hypothetical protein [Colwellia sp. 1_MG-2023]